jgi:hypothetical protein
MRHYRHHHHHHRHHRFDQLAKDASQRLPTIQHVEMKIPASMRVL